MKTSPKYPRQILNGINFGPVWGMSGVENFFGEGWPNHKILKSLGLLNFADMTFVSKTTTMHPRKLQDDLTPREWLPKCIYANPFKKIVLNAVSLSDIGPQALIDQGKWQSRKEPFFISFMSVANTEEERRQELREFIWIIKQQITHLKLQLGIQVNVSCPNTGDNSSKLHEILVMLNMLKVLSDKGIAIVLRLAINTRVEAIVELEGHPALAGICVSNTIPFRTMNDKIDWDYYFGKIPEEYKDKKLDWNIYKGPGGSPLVRRGIPLAGGLSGAPLTPLVMDWVTHLRDLGFLKPVNAGGGILHPFDALDLLDAGADSVSIGSAEIIRPWQVQKIIRGVHSYLNDA